jgi:phosphopantothenoylcysteine decarboxylase/phosphopantothenate--cysteine ligase
MRMTLKKVMPVTNNLENRQILVGVTGGIAAYKSAELIRRLRDCGATVRVVMTKGAREFITPLTLQAVSGNPVHADLFDLQAEAAMGHIELARWAEVILVAPASANFLARLAQGLADDLLSTVCLATRAPIVLAPAMNAVMWKNSLTIENIEKLRRHTFKIVEPDCGSQACGEIGPGRMPEPDGILQVVAALFQVPLLSGKKVIITAGPTHEAIDAVRYIANASSGKMGYALARAACTAGADVTLISGPTHLAVPAGLTCIQVISAKQMHAAVMRHIDKADIFIGVAAVGDFYCKNRHTEKIAKQDFETQLLLEKNPDIIAEVAQLPKRPLVIGFAAETRALIAHAKQKLINKKLDMIIANAVVASQQVFGSDENAVSVLWGDQQLDLPRQTKDQLSKQLIQLIAQLI